MRNILAVLIVVLLASSCTQTTRAPVPIPEGYWVGSMYYYYYGDVIYAGAVGADYDEGVWAWCVTGYDCIAGNTAGWDLVDSVGDRFRGSKRSDHVYVRYDYAPSEYFYSRMEPAIRTSEINQLDYQPGSIREFGQGIR